MVFSKEIEVFRKGLEVDKLGSL